MEKLKAVIVDPNRLSREGLLHILAHGDIDVMHEATDVDELAGESDLQPDLVLFDCAADAAHVVDDLKRLREWFPKARIVVLTGCEDVSLLISCYSGPVDGLISKNVSSSALLKSLQLVLVGERVFPSQLLTMVLGGQRRPAPPPARVQPSDPALSEREVEILQCLVCGDSNKVIANRLGIAEATIKVHLKGILRKVQVRNRTQAAIWALERGMQRGEFTQWDAAGERPLAEADR